MLRCILHNSSNSLSRPSRPITFRCLFCHQTSSSSSSFPRHFTTTARRGSQDGRPQTRGSFRSRLRIALRNTKVEWAPIPVGLGFAVVGAIQFYRVWEREMKTRKQEEDQALRSSESGESGGESHGRPKKRKRIRPSGPW